MTTKKLPPQNIEAEQNLLGAILVNADESLFKVANILHPKNFYKPAHRAIYAAMLDLFSQHKPIDIITVSEFLKNKGTLERVGGRAYINDLALDVITTANVDYYRLLKLDALNKLIGNHS